MASLRNVEYETQLSKPGISQSQKDKPKIVGIYGLPGSGKSYLLNILKTQLKHEQFSFFEGSANIASVVPGGLDAFQDMGEEEKSHWRRVAMESIEKHCLETETTGVVAGHLMFWSEGCPSGQMVCTEKDLNSYTHILYLDIPIETILQQRLNDTEKKRLPVSVNHTHKWQQAEKLELRKLCYENGILFSLLSPDHLFSEKALALLLDFQQQNVENNLIEAIAVLDQTIQAGNGKFETVLVFDADKTLAPEDSSLMFLNEQSSLGISDERSNQLRDIFSSKRGYSYNAFRQAALVFDEAAKDDEFEKICLAVASKIHLYPDILSLLKSISSHTSVCATVISCGLKRVWEIVLNREGLSNIGVIGGGRIADRYVVTPSVKGSLVNRLQDIHGLYVWAFGDSPVDLEMLEKADQAVVVVGSVHTRSNTMDGALTEAIHHRNLKARQAIFIEHEPPRLDNETLPLLRLDDYGFIADILRYRKRFGAVRVFHASDKPASKLLQTPTRDASNNGPTLRRAHRRIGWHLAMEFLTKIVDIEEFPILHVQGHEVSGYRVAMERKISIVALMRGGEPMALGVNDVLPNAMFIHADTPVDIKPEHLDDQDIIILVDSVINNGGTMTKFVQHVAAYRPTLRIIVMANVVEATSLSTWIKLCQAEFCLIALRLSNNKYIGTKTTDTGNRLFNTMHFL